LVENKIKEIIAPIFESLHGIPYILGAIEGSHLLVIVPKINPKSMIVGNFFSTLIRGIVNAKCIFCYYDYGW
jgi:hypothetical protein